MIDPIESPTQVTFILRGKNYLTAGNMTVAQALKRIGLTPEAYLFVRSGEVITEDQFLRPGDVIRIVPVISGGSYRP
jgi:sulfur carrier protein ThiS